MRIDATINARCLAITTALERQRPAGIRDVVPTYHTVAVHFDPLQLPRERLQAVLEALDENIEATSDQAQDPRVNELEVRVEYGGSAGPDLAAVAAFGGCSEADVIRLHTQAPYRVFMLGFLPGFAYLGTVDERIAMPRLETPRMKVPAGSVGIAGRQTGVYPFEAPGGWRLIGRTSLPVFDSTKEQPFLFSPGQRVRFVAA
jgi:KipI family sensor histidine kinase inhibitor